MLTNDYGERAANVHDRHGTIVLTMCIIVTDIILTVGNFIIIVNAPVVTHTCFGHNYDVGDNVH